MSLTLTYDGNLSRVRIAVTGLADLAPVRVERSTDQVAWTAVRGGASLTPSGGQVTLDDYEFAADTLNYYRVVGPSAWDSFTRTVAGELGTADTGQAWTIRAGAPAQFSVNGSAGLVVINAVNTIFSATLAGSLHDYSVEILLSVDRLSAGNDIDIELLGGWQDTSNFYAYRLTIPPTNLIDLRFSRVAGGIFTTTAAPSGITHVAGQQLVLRLERISGRHRMQLRRASDPVSDTWAIDTVDTTHGAGMLGLRHVLVTGNTSTLPVTVTHDSFVVTTPEATTFTASITPTLGGVWIKSIARPFLNRQVIVQDYLDVERPTRTGVFDVVGRSFPVAVNDVRGSRRWTLDVLTHTLAEAEDFDLVLASGDPLFIHVPADSAVPGGYVTVGDTRESRPTSRSVRRIFSLPCTEVAAPGPDVVGATVNWQTVLNAYSTWSDVLAAHPTWADLLELIGSPTDVVVP